MAIASVTLAADREPVVGGPCDGCEAVFIGIPESISSESRIAPPDEPGTPLRVEGTVRDTEGSPVAGVIVYAYHTNIGGRYPRDSSTQGTPAERHGMLRGWARSDNAGRYVFETVRPGGYPLSRIPEHIHMHVIEPGRCTYYIDDIVFEDDPRLTDTDRRRTSRARGGIGVAKPEHHESGSLTVRRDLILGDNIPDYPRRDS
ncbi:MAG TPA: hypothetical protein VMM36_10820 [Opitutaceae bacterium]|nr:hypothetical protein [Opitutaceae bacterium]